MMKILWGKAHSIETRNIALAPCAAHSGDGKEGRVIWYEYGSDRFPKPSSIWYSNWQGTGFGRPQKMIGSEGFNNGPQIFNGLLAWHSWRPPGELPFKSRGKSNIWMCENGRDFMPLRKVKNTSYPVILKGPDGKFWMSFISRDGLTLGLAKSGDAKKWDVISPALFDFPVEGADMVEAHDGEVWMVLVGKKNRRFELFITRSRDGRAWKRPVKLFETESKPARPRMSVDSENRIWASWHSDYWDPVSVEFDCEVKDGKLVQTIEAGKSPGNFCWAWNGMEVVSPSPRRFSSDPLPRRGRGVGVRVEFDGPVHFMSRIKGEGITRNLFYSEHERKITAHLPKGKYRIRNWISSWLASNKDVKLKVWPKGKAVHVAQAFPERERIYVACLGRTQPEPVPFSGIEANRPSRILHFSGNRHRIFFTGVTGKGIHIWSRDFRDVKN